MAERAASRRAAALVAVLVLVGASCSNSSEPSSGPGADPADAVDAPGVTDDEIAYAVMGTGPANPLGYCLLACYEAGVQAYFDYRNSEGGVHDRDLVIARVDDDEAGNTKVTLLELLEDPDVFGILAAPLTYDGFDDVGASGVPTYTTMPASPDADGHDNIYVPGGVQCVGCANPSTVQQAKQLGATKVAALGFGVHQASKDCAARIQRDVERYGAGEGVEFAYLNDDLAYGFPNGVGPEVTAMADAGVDLIAACIDQNSVVTLENELHRQRLDAAVALPQGYGDTTYLTENASLLEGDFFSLVYRPIEADPGDSEIETMTEWLGKADVQINDYAIQGWIGARTAVLGLEEAGPSFDRASVIAATNEVADDSAGGLLFPPVDWSRGHDARTDDGPGRWCSTVLVVQGDGSLELEGDPEAPFACWDLPLDGWAEPEIVG